MADSLEDAKKQVRARLLTQPGVHAVGLRRAANAVAVYVEADAASSLNGLVEDLRHAVAPYEIVIIKGPRASATSSRGAGAKPARSAARSARLR